ncbi:MAG: hypothetical protein NTZ34_02950 [Chloroflexi bacterium]|nr:hypothetical protein [Chloroflexota bacterium]
MTKRDTAKEHDATEKPGMPMLEAIEWQERYKTVALFPYSWLGRAQELLYCANIVLEKPGSGPLKGLYQNIGVYMMLTGYAFENLLKGLILAKEGEKVLSPKSWLFTHDLCELANKADLKCTEADSNLLGRLELFAVQGRYPIPRDWKPYKTQLDGTSKKRGEWSSHDLNHIVSFVHRIEGEFKLLGVECDAYDRSYYYTSSDRTIYVKRRTNPVTYTTG